MRVTASRRDGGKPLREAMSAAGFNRITLAARTKEVDTDGIGVSQQLIAFVSTDKEWGRETTSVRSAKLIAAAIAVATAETLGRKPDELARELEDVLFVMPASYVSTISTHT